MRPHAQVGERPERPGPFIWCAGEVGDVGAAPMPLIRLPITATRSAHTVQCRRSAGPPAAAIAAVDETAAASRGCPKYSGLKACWRQSQLVPATATFALPLFVASSRALSIPPAGSQRRHPDRAALGRRLFAQCLAACAEIRAVSHRSTRSLVSLRLPLSPFSGCGPVALRRRALAICAGRSPSQRQPRCGAEDSALRGPQALRGPHGWPTGAWPGRVPLPVTAAAGGVAHAWMFSPAAEAIQRRGLRRCCRYA